MPAASARRLVLADLIPASRAKDAALVLGGTGVVAVLSQVAIPLGFTPVPLSLGTLGALLVGAALGPARAVLSLLLYVGAGIAGVGWFAGGASGWMFASFGYLLGFVLAAALMGRLARRGADRNVFGSIGLGLLGGAVIYAAGVPWLMAFLDVSFTEALALGVTPFLIGDVIKAVIVAVVLPGAWALIGRSARS